MSFLCIYDYVVDRTHNCENALQISVFIYCQIQKRCLKVCAFISDHSLTLAPCAQSCWSKPTPPGPRSACLPDFFSSLLASSTGKVLESITMPFRAFKQNCSQTEQRNFGSAGVTGGKEALEPLPWLRRPIRGLWPGGCERQTRSTCVSVH